MAFASELPFLVGNGFGAPPLDSEVLRASSRAGLPRIGECRGAQLAKLEERARLLLPKLIVVRDSVSIDYFGTRARFHLPLLEELKPIYRRRFVEGGLP